MYSNVERLSHIACCKKQQQQQQQKTIKNARKNPMYAK